MASIAIVGFAAASCTTFAFLPQVIKTWTTRSTKDVSLGMFLVFTVGVFLWLVYGLLEGDIPIIASNSLTLLFAAIILGLKLRHG